MTDQPQRTAPPFDLQPRLGGRLVALRPLLSDDFDALFAVASDPLIWEQHPDKSRSTPDGFRRFFDVAIASRGALLATDGASGQVIGSSRFHGPDPAADEVEIGWTFLARSHWGGRYNREMKDLMIRHAFRFVRHVVFVVAPGNVRSQRALAKIGAARVADRRDASGAPLFVFQVDADRYRFSWRA